MKYEYGTILKFTEKAIKKRPNHCESNDRMIVVGKNECIWYKNEKTLNAYADPAVEIPENTILAFDMYRAFDSFVEKTNEELPQLIFKEECYSGGYIDKEILEKYQIDFNIKMITEFKKSLIQ